VLISTDHDNVDYSALRAARLIVDTRNVCAQHNVNSPNIVKA
jgi:UDP-N-acetyl-D-glucosamine dehydrogenase